MFTRNFKALNTAILIAAVVAATLSCTDTSTKSEARNSAPSALPAVTTASEATIPADTTTAQVATETPAAAPTAVAGPAGILARKEVPILCYHQIRNWTERDSKGAKDYIVPVANFREQIKMLADSGYQTVLPDQLMAYLTTGAPLPAKPVMLTFDDTNLDQFTEAAPTLEKYGFKGVFFVMTVSIGRPRYMNRAQLKSLADKGHVIGSHTWDHHNVKKYEGKDWVTQVEKPTRQLEEITGQKIKYFAYPFGLWNQAAIPELKSRGMEAAFQLAAKRDEQDPQYTIRRIIASGYWSSRTLYRNMVNSFR